MDTKITRRTALALTALATLVGSKDPTFRRLSERVFARDEICTLTRFPRALVT